MLFPLCTHFGFPTHFMSEMLGYQRDRSSEPQITFVNERYNSDNTRVYQIVHDDNGLIQYERTTIEACNSVLYTDHDITDSYQDTGSSPYLNLHTRSPSNKAYALRRDVYETIKAGGSLPGDYFSEEESKEAVIYRFDMVYDTVNNVLRHKTREDNKRKVEEHTVIYYIGTNLITHVKKQHGVKIKSHPLKKPDALSRFFNDLKLLGLTYEQFINVVDLAYNEIEEDYNQCVVEFSLTKEQYLTKFEKYITLLK